MFVRECLSYTDTDSYYHIFDSFLPKQTLLYTSILYSASLSISLFFSVTLIPTPAAINGEEERSPPCMQRNMASGRDYRALFIVMLLLLPSIQSARLLEEEETSVAAAASPSPAFSGEELLQVERTGGGGAPASKSMGDSERVVPTGPDPLHHNHSPVIRRPKP